jgi:hypothetical protein
MAECNDGAHKSSRNVVHARRIERTSPQINSRWTSGIANTCIRIACALSSVMTVLSALSALLPLLRRFMFLLQLTIKFK